MLSIAKIESPIANIAIIAWTTTLYKVHNKKYSLWYLKGVFLCIISNYFTLSKLFLIYYFLGLWQVTHLGLAIFLYQNSIYKVYLQKVAIL